MNINFKPFYLSFNIGNKHFFFGWCYKLKTYMDFRGEKPVLKTRKEGYQSFRGVTNRYERNTGESQYEKMIKSWNGGN